MKRVDISVLSDIGLVEALGSFKLNRRLKNVIRQVQPTAAYTFCRTDELAYVTEGSVVPTLSESHEASKGAEIYSYYWVVSSGIPGVFGYGRHLEAAFSDVARKIRGLVSV